MIRHLSAWFLQAQITEGRYLLAFSGIAKVLKVAREPRCWDSLVHHHRTAAATARMLDITTTLQRLGDRIRSRRYRLPSCSGSRAAAGLAPPARIHLLSHYRSLPAVPPHDFRYSKTSKTDHDRLRQAVWRRRRRATFHPNRVGNLSHSGPQLDICGKQMRIDQAHPVLLGDRRSHLNHPWEATRKPMSHSRTLRLAWRT